VTPRIAAVATALALGLAGCAAGVDPNAPQPEDSLALAVTPTLGGLTVKLSEKATQRVNRKAAERNTYLRESTVFELRTGKELAAVFQVIRLSPDARTEDLEFRRSLVASITQTSRAPLDVGGVPVYKATINKQIVHVWFEERFLQVLIVRSDAAAGGAFGPAIDVNRLLVETLALELRPVS